jgi:hypothetical protein
VLTLQFGSPQLAWRLGYAFAGSLTLRGADPHTYSNQATFALASELTARSTLGIYADVSQGSTFFQLSHRPADAGEPAFRAPGSPAQVAATLGQTLRWQPSEDLRFGQGFTASVNAPQDDLGQFDMALTGSLRLDRVYSKDAIGAEFRPRVSVLRPLTADTAPYVNVTNSLLGNWNHDFSWRWNGQVMAGVEQVLTMAGSYPLAIVPAGSLTVRYLGQGGTASFSLTRGSATDLQTGTVSMSTGAVLRGAMNFDAFLPGQLAASAGFLHADALGDVTSRAAAGIGNAVQGDAALVVGLSNALLASARYTIAYQFDQGGGLPPSLAHVILVGLSVRWSNSPLMPAMPSAGSRVDGGDGVSFGGDGVSFEDGGVR